MKDSLLTTHMYWSTLHWIVELHLSGLHREKCTKKKKNSDGVLKFLATPSGFGWLAEWCQLRQMHMLRKDPSADSDGGWAWLAYRASCTTLAQLVSICCWSSFEGGPAENFWHPCWSLLLTCANLTEVWSYYGTPLLLSWYYCTGLLVHQRSVFECIELTLLTC